MALVGFGYLSTQEKFEQFSNTKDLRLATSLFRQEIEEIHDELPVIGVMDGVDDWDSAGGLF